MISFDLFPDLWFLFACVQICVRISRPSSWFSPPPLGCIADLLVLLHRCFFVTVGGDGRVVFREFHVFDVKEEAIRFLGLCGGDWWQ